MNSRHSWLNGSVWKSLFLRCLVEVTGLRIMYRNSSFAKYPNVMVFLIKAISVNQNKRGKFLFSASFNFLSVKKSCLWMGLADPLLKRHFGNSSLNRISRESLSASWQVSGFPVLPVRRCLLWQSGCSSRTLWKSGGCVTLDVTSERCYTCDVQGGFLGWQRGLT